MPKYPKISIQVNLLGPGGNACAILGAVERGLQAMGCDSIEREQFSGEATSGDYEHLLETCREWVTFDTYEQKISPITEGGYYHASI